MSPSMALVFAIAVAVVVLAFAYAGLLMRVRRLEVAERVGATILLPQRDAAIAALAPTGNAVITVALIVDEGCSSCPEAAHQLASAAAAAEHEAIDHVLLADHALGPDFPTGFVRLVVDPTTHASLHPGWTPAMAIVDREKGLLGIEPVGSTEALKTVVTRVNRLASAAIPH